MNLKIYLSIVTFQLILTFLNFYNTCQGFDFHRFMVYFLHHFSDVYLFWAPLFLETKQEFIYHLMFAIGIVIHWITYNNRCIATVYMNRLCGYDEDVWLDAIHNRLGLREVNEYFQTIWIGLLMAYDIYKIKTV